MTSKERTSEHVQKHADDSQEYKFRHSSTYSYDGTTGTTVDDFSDITTNLQSGITVSDNSRHSEKTEEGSYTLDINKDGTHTYKSNINLTAESMDYVNDTMGTDMDTTYTDKNRVLEATDAWWWENSKKKKVLITLAGMGTYKIVRLSNKDMIWEFDHDFKREGEFAPFETEYVNNINERITWSKQ